MKLYGNLPENRYFDAVLQLRLPRYVPGRRNTLAQRRRAFQIPPSPLLTTFVGSAYEVVAWPFGDCVFNTSWDVMSSVTKSRLHGFHEVVDSEEMFARLLTRFREERIVP